MYQPFVLIIIYNHRGMFLTNFFNIPSPISSHTSQIIRFNLYNNSLLNLKVTSSGYLFAISYFQTFYRFFMGLKSGFQTGHSINSTLFSPTHSYNQSCIYYTLYMGTLFYINILPGSYYRKLFFKYYPNNKMIN